jgi:hypothetical protein
MDKREQIAAERCEQIDDSIEQQYGENDFVFYRGKVTPTQVPEWGTGYRVDLWAHSEDGRQDEFTGEFLEREEADLVLSAWLTTQGRALLYLGARLRNAQESAS